MLTSFQALQASLHHTVASQTLQNVALSQSKHCIRVVESLLFIALPVGHMYRSSWKLRLVVL
jgi:hypothetical protein